MSFFADVREGAKFAPSALLSNSVRAVVNSSKHRIGAGQMQRVGAPASLECLKTKVYNATAEALPALSPVSLGVLQEEGEGGGGSASPDQGGSSSTTSDSSTNTESDSSSSSNTNKGIPCRKFDNSSAFWGVLTKALQPGESCDCIISGIVDVNISADPTQLVPGAYVAPIRTEEEEEGGASSREGEEDISDSGSSSGEATPYFAPSAVGDLVFIRQKKKSLCTCFLGTDKGYNGYFKLVLTTGPVNVVDEDVVAPPENKLAHIVMLNNDGVTAFPLKSPGALIAMSKKLHIWPLGICNEGSDSSSSSSSSEDTSSSSSSSSSFSDDSESVSSSEGYEGELRVALIDGADPTSDVCGFIYTGGIMTPVNNKVASLEYWSDPGTVYCWLRRSPKGKIQFYLTDTLEKLPGTTGMVRLIGRIIISEEGTCSVIQEQHGPIMETCISFPKKPTSDF